MAFRIMKVVAWSMFGWWLYRSLTTHGERAEARPGDGSPEDLAAAPEEAAAPATDDLRRVRGIGPGIEGLLKARGIRTWARLAATEVGVLRAILDEAGPRYRGHDPATWPDQAAELAAAN